MEDNRIYDLCIVTDATASMGIYLHSLNESLPEIIKISALTGCFSRIGIVAYRDYCGGDLTEWSGWHGLDDRADLDSVPAHEKATRQQLLDFAKRLVPDHGGDWPEAAKTGLARMYANMREDVGTVVVFFTDAPPHTTATGGTNREREIAALIDDANQSLYGPEGAAFYDWVSLTKTLRTGRKQARVFSIVQSHLVDTLAPFTYLSARTGGACFEIPPSCGSAVISQVTLGILLTWMGVAKKEAPSTSAGTAANHSIASVCRYRDTSGINKIPSEFDDKCETYWVRKDVPAVTRQVKENFQKIGVTLSNFKEYVAARKPAMVDFSVRYKTDAAYRDLVITNLEDIIKTDVAAVTVNPIFGSLWRTVCNDRTNEGRDHLLSLFSVQVDSITDLDKKSRLKLWLEESYDYEAEILEMVASVPAAEQFPCVLRDPTIDFAKLAGEGEDDENAAKELTRADLLEIGRSCDAKILRRLGRTLARLTYVATEADLPAHLDLKTAAPGEPGYVTRIPLALARPEFNRKFWKVLLHTIVPGTMLGPRPAALLAALSLRMGMAPLRDAADRELLNFAPKWNTLDIPETWNTNCLNLLLSADQDYAGRVVAGTTAPVDPATKTPTAVLSNADRALFKALVDYKLAEINLGTTLTARVGWQPDKTKTDMGPTTVCRVCHFPRSVTIMSAKGICGMCDKDACTCATPAIHAEYVAANVSAEDTATTPLWWVECSVRACRSQYVVYNPDKLRVRPKCHYCRNAGTKSDDSEAVTTAPFVECHKCLSRIIWPTAYRPASLDTKAYECPACTAGVATVVDVATDARQLIDENHREWLLRNTGGKILEPFNGRSLFYTISNAGTKGFADAVEVLPNGGKGVKLTIKGKAVRNADAVVAELSRWISSRRAEAEACSLCFSTFSKKRLRTACGRRGCEQRICGSCHRDWYGLNGRGKILNVAALHCPFCRRQPAPSVVSAFGLNVLGNLKAAVDNAGTWIYAWCNDCGLAQEFAQRVCARGAPLEVSEWQCDECEVKAAEQRGEEGLRHKPCPGCGTMTEKMGGCDHIACTVEGCNCHWCFFCGKEVDHNEIYNHMSEEHGGWYDGADEEVDNEYDEEYDSDYGR